MRRGETEKIGIQVNTDVSQFDEIEVAVKQGYSNIIIFKGKDVLKDGDTISINMTQEQTLSFHRGTYKVQARFLAKDGAVYSTDILEGTVGDCLSDAVLRKGL